jgi:hypothetical protein
MAIYSNRLRSSAAGPTNGSRASRTSRTTLVSKRTLNGTSLRDGDDNPLHSRSCPKGSSTLACATTEASGVLIRAETIHQRQGLLVGGHGYSELTTPTGNSLQEVQYETISNEVL